MKIFIMQLRSVPGEFYKEPRQSRVVLFDRRDKFYPKYAIAVPGKKCKAEVFFDSSNSTLLVVSKIIDAHNNGFSSRLIAAIHVHLSLLEVGIYAPIIISGGISKEFIDSAVSRVSLQSEEAGRAIRRIILGPLSEAEAGAKFIIDYCTERSLSVPLLVIEPYSLDTIGNGIFTKLLIDVDKMFSNLRELILISSPEHIERTELIYKHCFIGHGRRSIHIYSAIEPVQDDNEDQKRKTLNREFLTHAFPADQNSLLMYLRNVHPMYDRAHLPLLYVKPAEQRIKERRKVLLPTEFMLLERLQELIKGTDGHVVIESFWPDRVITSSNISAYVMRYNASFVQEQMRQVSLISYFLRY